jgi:predicted pyridoxine 5'-phosphate oxidase superfamily flavin-nucleotide-binding protein
MRERLEQIGPRAIRSYMPDEHRELFGRLPMLVVGSLDADRRPWASVLIERPGFIASPDERTLRVSAAPALGDPLRANLQVNAPIALLGIELATRRRNRANGTVTAVRDRGFDVHVQQSFGNCPQYIQARSPSFVADPRSGEPLSPTAAASRREGSEGRVLSARAAALVARADTFFIATAANAPAGDARHGCDVSHRGGNPGFVRVEREPHSDADGRDADGSGAHGAMARGNDGARSVLYWPDFRGNFFFNTLGNLAVNSRAGLLFMDFESGAALLLTGMAEVIWDGPLVTSFAGAERMLRFAPEAGVWVQASAALRWSAPERARQLAATGP